MLALQGSAYTEVDPYPLDLLGAQTEGMIGYLIQQELGNELPQEKRLASLLTLIEVDPTDPAFADPTKPIGPIYQQDESERLAQEKGWVVQARWRQLPPGRPLAACRSGSSAIEPVEWLLEHDAVVICAGGGGIPVMYTDEPAPAGRQLVGVEAVIDKDLASALLAKNLRADALAIVTDVDAVYADWGTPEQRAIRRATPEALAGTEFAAGSMGPKVRAACSFVEETGGLAAIGSIEDTPALLRGEAGTIVTREAAGIELGETEAGVGRPV